MTIIVINIIFLSLLLFISMTTNTNQNEVLGSIYLIKKEECDEYTFKLGCSRSNTIKRLTNYLRGPKVIFRHEVKNPLRIERIIFNKLNIDTRFSRIGESECFRGNKRELKQFILQILVDYDNNLYDEETNEEITEEINEVEEVNEVDEINEINNTTISIVDNFGSSRNCSNSALENAAFKLSKYIHR